VRAVDEWLTTGSAGGGGGSKPVNTDGEDVVRLRQISLTPPLTDRIQSAAGSSDEMRPDLLREMATYPAAELYRRA